MPNWVTNKLTFIGNKEDIDKLMNSISSVNEDGTVKVIDFNNIICMPKGLRMDTSCPSLYDALTHKEDCESFFRYFNMCENLASMIKGIKEFYRYKKNYEKYGYASWYEWSSDNWGTKWNACETQKLNDNSIIFETAWSMPLPVIVSMSILHPTVEILLEYADEDYGRNFGRIRFKNGKVDREKMPEDYSKEALKFCFTVTKENPKDYGYDENFERIKDDEDE